MNWGWNPDTVGAIASIAGVVVSTFTLVLLRDRLHKAVRWSVKLSNTVSRPMRKLPTRVWQYFTPLVLKRPAVVLVGEKHFSFRGYYGPGYAESLKEIYQLVKYSFKTPWWENLMSEDDKAAYKALNVITTGDDDPPVLSFYDRGYTAGMSVSRKAYVFLRRCDDELKHVILFPKGMGFMRKAYVYGVHQVDNVTAVVAQHQTANLVVTDDVAYSLAMVRIASVRMTQLFNNPKNHKVLKQYVEGKSEVIS